MVRISTDQSVLLRGIRFICVPLQPMRDRTQMERIGWIETDQDYLSYPCNLYSICQFIEPDAFAV